MQCKPGDCCGYSGNLESFRSFQWTGWVLLTNSTCTSISVSRFYPCNPIKLCQGKDCEVQSLIDTLKHRVSPKTWSSKRSRVTPSYQQPPLLPVSFILSHTQVKEAEKTFFLLIHLSSLRRASHAISETPSTSLCSNSFLLFVLVHAVLLGMCVLSQSIQFPAQCLALPRFSLTQESN